MEHSAKTVSLLVILVVMAMVGTHAVSSLRWYPNVDQIQKEDLPRLRKLSPTLFVNPGKVFFVTPIWYKFVEEGLFCKDDDTTSTGSTTTTTTPTRWYWTPFPKGDVLDEDARWIPVSQIHVPTDIPVQQGKWLSRSFLGQVPVAANVHMIHYLHRYNPMPDDLETYE